MRNQKVIVALFTTGLAIGILFTGVSAANADKATPKLRVEGDRLVVIAARLETTFDGIYENAQGEGIEFADGKPLTIIDKERSKTSIDEIKIENGKVVFGGDGNDILLENGKYERQGDPEPQPKPEPEPQPRPNPNAFEVRDGEIVTVWF